MTLAQLLDHLRLDPISAPRITAWREIPERQATWTEFPPGLHPRLAAALRRRGIEALYSHQAESYEAVRRGEDIVVITPTASGKTLCYNLPVLDRILVEPETRALYLFPTKALSADQVDELQSLIQVLRDLPGTGPDGTRTGTDGSGNGLDGSGGGIKTFTYDGDTPASARRAIRAAGHIVVTNPDMLHTGILPHHTKWLRLFENLRFVVLDELHQYRGVFGSHVANVLRRLRRVCRFYGSDPRFICTSATIGNAQEHAGRLLERPVTLIDRSGAPSGPKVIAFINPPVINRELGIRRDTLLEVRDLADELVRNRIPTIAFARSRLAVELLTTYLRDLAQRHGQQTDAVRGYRAGYLPSERRAIERGLRDGSVRAVAATNALELGIDIGQLTASILAGYPGTIASTWQQMGRAGRTTDLSAAFLVASSGPLDQYIVRHPEYFFDHSPEQALINPDNVTILTSHLKCAAFELPVDAGEAFGPSTLPEIMQRLEREGIVHDDAGRWHYIAEAFPAEEVSLRSASTENVVIIDTSAPNPRVVGEVDLASAPALVHEGAIYLHLAQQYHVDRLDWEERKAYVRPVSVDYYTDAQIAVQVRVLDEFATTPEPETAPERDTAAARADGADHRPKDAGFTRGHGFAHAHGEVVVTYRPTIYKKLRLFSQENVGWGKIALPESTVHTTSYWIALPEAVISGFTTERVQGALAALAHALRNVAPLFLMCDPRDLAEVYEIRSPHTGRPTVHLYEGTPGGIGLAERLFRFHRELLAGAASIVEACPCAAGCPSCVGPVMEVGATGKADALALLRSAIAQARVTAPDAPPHPSVADAPGPGSAADAPTPLPAAALHS